MRQKISCRGKRRFIILCLSMLCWLTGKHLVDAEDISEIISENGSGYELSDEYGNELYNMIPYPHGTCRTSFIDKLEDGNYQTVIYDEGVLYIENFNNNLESISSKQIEVDLPLWGGFYSGKEYNYVVSGNDYDPNAEGGGIVYCITQYDKGFNKVDSISFWSKQTYTQKPFDAGNVSIDEFDNMLTVYTSRLRLDGHQSNIAFVINTDDMSLVDTNGITSFPDIHVSHSFRQIFKYDNDFPVYVDLSDGYPERSVYLQYGVKIGAGHTAYYGGALVPISGQTGHNVTNAEVSGLEISDTHYLVVGTYVNQSASNVYLACMEKQTGEVISKWLTDATRFMSKYQHNPRITQIADDRFVVFWGTEINGEQSVKYIIVDEAGEILSGVKEAIGVGVTDCEPIYDGNRIIWLLVRDGKKEFEIISDFAETGTFELGESIVEPVNPWDGTLDTSWYNDIATSFNISTPQQLAGLANLVNGGNDFEGKTVYLMNDIFMNGNSYSNIWIPMEEWQGTFHGNGNTIYNMYTYGDGYGGLFNVIGEKGIVKAVDLAQGVFNHGSSVADENYGIIAFCNNYSQVNCNEDAGGICNVNYNLIQGCRNYGEIRGETTGGIACSNRKTTAVISQCSNWGMVSGIHDVGGIVGYNYGWLYNCYNRGMLMDTCLGSSMNLADSLSGIAFRDTSGNHIESCYSIATFIYDREIWRGAHAILCEGKMEGVLNCYTKPMTGYKDHSDEATTLSASQMRKESFVDKLNIQAHTVLPAWIADTEGLNNGFPITVAEYNAARGVYKIQPELWMTNAKQIAIATGEQKTIPYKCYYNEAAPIISSDNTSVARVNYTSDNIVVEAVSSGITYLTIEFLETENNIAQIYQIELVVNESGEIENIFADVPQDQWFYPYVKKAYDNGYMSGTGTDSEGKIIFKPLVNIPREQFVTVLYALEGVDPDSIQYTDRFSDVKESDWFAKPVEWAAQNGIVSGVADGEFGVGQLITREQMALMLFKYAGYKGYDVTVTADISSFPDVNDVSSWAMEAMRWAIQNGVMSGQQMDDGIYLKPKDNASRAVCATMIVAFAEKY